ncbi:hypothetical protein T439DRAFT_340821 [Meredithblackwellia eburnea MCA 4105]
MTSFPTRGSYSWAGIQLVHPGYPLAAIRRFRPSKEACSSSLRYCCFASSTPAAKRFRGLSNVVRWDNVSLFIHDQRVFIQAGEFHPWRLPSRELWRDVLQKMHAAGLNTVSSFIFLVLEAHWGLVNPSPGVFDWTGIRDLSVFLDIAQQVGLWVILRPGPYINAETTGGGFPGWVTTVNGTLRTDDLQYEAAWTPYIREVCQIAKSYQVSHGGPVILVQVENELAQNAKTEGYFRRLMDVMRDEGIDVPLTTNDWGMNNYYSKNPAPDIYGFDSYPQGFDCSNPDTWSAVIDEYAFYHQGANPSQPLYIPECELIFPVKLFNQYSNTSGAFDPWGPGAPGYENCREMTGMSFESVFYKSLWAANAKLISYYMVYGGTNWGNLAYPGVYTSYDYGAAISEGRELTPKYTELKLQSFFLRSARDFTNTRIQKVDQLLADKSSASVRRTELVNPKTGAVFSVLRNQDSTSHNVINFTFPNPTSSDQVHGRMSLHGRESKVVSSGHSFGAGSSIVFTTATILFANSIGDRDVLFLHAALGEEVELLLQASGFNNVGKRPSNGPAIITFNQSSSPSGPTYLRLSTSVTGLSQLLLSSTFLLIFSDSTTAATFYNPPMSATGNRFANFHSFGTNDSVLVGGAPLVRNSTLVVSTLHLFGDTVASKATNLVILAPLSVDTVVWNGQPEEVFANSSSGFLSALIPAADTSTFVLPKFDRWKFGNSLPEIESEFNDSRWAVADQGRDDWGSACHHGFCEGVTIWRGHFTSSGEGIPFGINVTVSGGQAFAASLWLNSIFLGTANGNSSNNMNKISEITKGFPFPPNLLEMENVVALVLDNMGREEGNEDEPKSLRGLRYYNLIGGGGRTMTWLVQGMEGGNEKLSDTMRGVLNEGGFFAERQGWHRPDFDHSTWEDRSPNQGLTKPGVGFFTTTFNLSFASGFDTSVFVDMGDIDISSVCGAYRAWLFVNGWQVGKFVSNLGYVLIFNTFKCSWCAN